MGTGGFIVVIGFGLCFAAFGSLFVWLFILSPWLRSQEAASWSEVPAVVLSSEIAVNRSGDGGPTYRPNIVYRYEFDGEPFESNVYGPAGHVSTSDRSAAFEAVKRHPPGEDVSAYINPADPADAMLNRDWSLGLEAFVLVFPMAGLIVAAVGVIGLLLHRRGKEEPTPWGRGASSIAPVAAGE